MAILVDAVHYPIEPGARSVYPYVVLADMSTGEALAKREIGLYPDIGVSADGSLAAVVSKRLLAGRPEPSDRLLILDTADLSVVAEGRLPFKDRINYNPTHYPTTSFICFSPDNQSVLVPRGEMRLTDDEPFRRTVRDVTWTAVRWSDEKDGDVFRICNEWKDVTVQRASRNPIVSSARWPRVDVGIRMFGALYSIDGDLGQVRQRLVLTDSLGIRRFSPDYVERHGPSTGFNGLVVSSPSGSVAYYVPESKSPGKMKRIDMRGDLPKVVVQSDTPHDGLDPFVAAATDDALFVAPANDRERGDSQYVHPRTILVFDGATLQESGRLDLDVDYSFLSVDAGQRLLYAYDYDHRQISVIDISSGKVVRRFEDLARVPRLLISFHRPQE